MRQFIDKSYFGVARQHSFQVHLLQQYASVLNLFSGNHFQALDELGRIRSPVSFDKPDNHVDAFLLQTAPFKQHLPGFPDSWPIPQINLELALAVSGVSVEGS